MSDNMKRTLQMTIKKLAIAPVAIFLSFALANIASAEMEMYFIHNDHLGTPQVVTDENQSVVWQADYQPFGEVDVTQNQIDQDARFPGQYTDSETGLHYNYFRDYDPTIGRYIQSDPIGINYDFSDPQMQVAIQSGIPLQSSNNSPLGLNHLYGYVDQKPINDIDPYGLAPRKRPKITKPQCELDCQELQQALIRACQATGFAFFACKAEVDQIIIECIVNGKKPPECEEKKECEDEG